MSKQFSDEQIDRLVRSAGEMIANAHVQEHYEGCETYHPLCMVARLAAAIRQLRQEAKAMKRDTKRYLWWKTHGLGIYQMEYGLSDAEVDADIAAMEAMVEKP